MNVLHWTVESLASTTQCMLNMRGSRIFFQGGGGGGGGWGWGGGGGGVQAPRPENSLDNFFFSPQLILQFTEWVQWFY